MRVSYGAVATCLRLLTSTYATPEDATITSGVIFYDDSGAPVHAHGAGILLPHSHPAGAGGKYFMVGTSQKLDNNGGWLSEGINIYSSYDLESWHFEGLALRNVSITTPLPLDEPPMYRIERPKLVYNAKTKMYVIYFHLDSVGFKLGMVGVCTSATIAREYQFIHGFQPDGLRSFDMTLFQDSDRSVYLVRSVDNKYTGISKLTDDYLNTTEDGIVSQAPKCEGQAVWRDRDGYYMFASHLTGWNANPAILSHTPGPLVGAKWTILGNPSGSDTTYNSQSTFVLPYTRSNGQELLLYMGDRWRPSGQTSSLPNASYVWLPMYKNVHHSMGFTLDGLDGEGNGKWKISDFPKASALLDFPKAPASLFV